MSQEQDRVVYRQDLCQALRVGSEAVRRWIKAGKLPQPDVKLSQRTMGWKLSTLQKAGIGIL